MMKMTPKVLLVSAVGAVGASSSLAQENQTLPGVTPPKPIVTAPPPEPDRMTDPAKPNTFRIGNTEVTVSGSITVDVGTFKSSGR